MLRDLTRLISLLVVHCSDSPDEDSLFRRDGAGVITRTPVQEIDDWHAKRGFHRDEQARARFNPELRAIGYHLVIYRNGAVATGRAFSEVGSHVAGHNAHSLGICMLGRERFSADQWASLADLVRGLGLQFKRRIVTLDADEGAEASGPGVLRLCGHRDLSPDADGDGTVEPREWLKTCPNFDVGAWFKSGMTPDPAHVWTEPPSTAKDPS